MIVHCPKCERSNRLPAARLNERANCAACKAALLPLGKPVSIESDAEFQELVANSPFPVVVDFWASWCGPCRAVAPELEKMASAKAGTVVVAKVDTDAHQAIAGRFRIQSIPTLLAFRGGKEAARVSGAMSASAIAQGLGV